MNDKPQKNEEDSPEKSPNSLFIGDGDHKGVRKLNNRPLLLVGALAFLVIIAITYTFYKRGHPSQAGVANPLVTSQQTSEDTTQAHPPVRPSDSRKPTYSSSSSSAEQEESGGAGETQGKKSQRAQIRERAILQMEEKQYTSAENALLNGSAVNAFSSGKIRATGQISNTNSQSQLAQASSRLQATARRLASISNGNTTVPQLDTSAGIQGTGTGLGMMGMDTSGGSSETVASANGQAEKAKFINNTAVDKSTYLSHSRTDPLTKTEIKAGTIIPGVMISGINSDLPGMITAQVSQNVYDTATGHYLLIPAGARLIGTYDSNVTYGQSRALVGWSRIIYPDGSSLTLGKMSGTDQSGYSGFEDQVNNHFWKIFGNAMMLSLFSAGVQLSQPDSDGDDYTSQQIIAASMGQQLGEVGMAMARKGMNIQPTITIRPGYKFNVMVRKDIILPVWNR